MKDSFLQKGNRGEECSPFIIAHPLAQEMRESQFYAGDLLLAQFYRLWLTLRDGAGHQACNTII